MKMRYAITAGFVLAFAVAACGDQPAGPSSVAPAAASYDGGLMLGSGHRSGSDSTGTQTTATTSSDSTGRGGLMLGSGH